MSAGQNMKWKLNSIYYAPTTHTFSLCKTAFRCIWSKAHTQLQIASVAVCAWSAGCRGRWRGRTYSWAGDLQLPGPTMHLHRVSGTEGFFLFHPIRSFSVHKLRGSEGQGTHPAGHYWKHVSSSSPQHKSFCPCRLQHMETSPMGKHIFLPQIRSSGKGIVGWKQRRKGRDHTCALCTFLLTPCPKDIVPAWYTEIHTYS